MNTWYNLKDLNNLALEENDIDTLKDCSKKIGNTIDIKTFQSTSIDINIALNFFSFGGILLQIDTNNYPYFYLHLYYNGSDMLHYQYPTI